MGRSKQTVLLKNKSPVPVQLPHDGPLARLIQQPATKPTKDEELALGLLSSDESAITPTLCRTLTNAKTAKEQLHALQSFRSTLLNLKRKPESSSSSLPDHNTSIGLFRLLLEWSLSIHSPLPLQRAIQSNLNTLDVNHAEVATQVLQSFWDREESCWEDTLHCLEVAVSYAPLASLLQSTLRTDCLSFLAREKIPPYLNATTMYPSLLEEGLRLADILKQILKTSTGSTEPLPCSKEIEQFALSLLSCPNLPGEGFSTLGIVYGRVAFRGKDAPSLAQAVVQHVEQLDDRFANLADVARLSMVQGIASTLDSHILMNDGGVSPLESCWKYTLRASQAATDPLVRWAALKGLSTLATRWKQKKQEESENLTTHDLIHETLQVVLQAWENPPLRKIGTAIPGLFKTLVELLSEEQLQELCRRVLQQPVNRKGRYLALETLLPILPSGETIRADSLIEGIGDRGPNTGPIADLWTKVLAHTWKELQNNGNETAFESWLAHWVPSLALSLLEGDLSRRKQVASFCLPRVVKFMKGNESLQPLVEKAIVALLDEVGRRETEGTRKMSLAVEDSSLERALWAKLAMARYAHLHKLLTPNVKASIANHVPEATLKMALTHTTPALRLSAFQSLEPVVASYLKSTEEETALWRYALPFSVKTTESKEYTSSLLQALTAFLDRFSTWEVKTYPQNEDAKQEPSSLPKLRAFLVDFLIEDLVTTRGAYPGTVADKEGFCLTLFETLLSFSLQDQSYSSDNCILSNGVIFNRRRKPAEIATMDSALSALLGTEPLACLFSFLHSIWDNTRLTAFRLLSKLVIASQSKLIPLPIEYRGSSERGSLYARGLYLASSPRQREADTGARILAFLYMSLSEERAKDDFLSGLVATLESRLSSMKTELTAVLTGKTVGEDSTSSLPLAHGIIQAIFLTVKHRKLAINGIDNATVNQALCDRMISVFSEALKVSLTVVADVREGALVEGMDELSLDCGDEASTPLNVNTGAIGANGTFSKLSSTNGDEEKRRLATQRIVIGTWLLTKEACAALSATVAINGFSPTPEVVHDVGVLLISTLTSLKHAGAAFAARDSLQEMATTCLSSTNESLKGLPAQWATRLLGEISANERVRDSTLRRSTGYALGFLALMRSERSLKSSSPQLSPRVLDRILMLSLPSKGDVLTAFSKLGIFSDVSDKPSVIFYSSRSVDEFFVALDDYEVRSRVHALNVLRLIILDAPLTAAVRPYIGDAIVSAILGYDDPSWAVRNSATMVFSAAMLRVIDADKNASNNDRTSSQAITISELFRRYPPLEQFLPAVLKKGLSDSVLDNPQIFPILLLLSRVQAISRTAETSVSHARTFTPLLLRSLSNKHNGIRAAAARSLANLCSVDRRCSASSFEVLKWCQELISSPRGQGVGWNLVDGALQTIHTLVGSSDAARDAFNDLAMLESIGGILQIGDKCPRNPPSCLATCLDILDTMCKSTHSHEAATLLEARCQAVLSCSTFEAMIGGATLYSSAARSTNALLQTGLWRPNDESSFRKSLKSLEGLLTSDLFDVRLVAVKVFKKGVYGQIDKLLANDNCLGLGVPRKQVIAGVGGCLLHCLSVELGRGKASREQDSAHVPTVRRLSRCFLECFYGFQAVAHDSKLLDFVRGYDLDSLWSSARDMTSIEGLFDATVAPASNGEAFLSGNAAELMSIVVCMEVLNKEPNVEHIDFFVNVIKRLNDPQASWRSRHSAAVAITTSRTLGEYAHQAFKPCVLGMLQDEDSDVRNAVVRAASQLQQSSVDDSQSLSMQLPELCLRQTFPVSNAISKERSSEDTVEAAASSLLGMILANCNGIHTAMVKLDDELSRTRHDAKVHESSLTNAATSRRIFEAEDPNPFYERALSNQLAVQSLLQHQSLDAHCAVEAREELLSLCHSSLKLTHERLGAGGMIHDLTRSPLVFPSLHGIISAVAAIVFLFEIDTGVSAEVQKLADGIVIAESKLETKSLHPEILLCLTTLVQARAGDKNSTEPILKTCFLLRELC